MSRHFKIDIDTMREAGRIAANVLKRVADEVRPGVTTMDLDAYAQDLIAKYGAKSACYGYKGNGKIFPSFICVSMNEEVVHGIPSPKRIIQEGDLVSIDVCVMYNGHAADNAKTVPAGTASEKNLRLIAVAEEALQRGIEKAIANNRVGDITFAIQKTIERSGFSIVKEFVGHGIGRELHQEPQIPNCGLAKGTGHLLKPGMALAIEPMLNLGLPAVAYMPDGWTVVAMDGKPSAHCEHTIFVTENVPEILTLPTN